MKYQEETFSYFIESALPLFLKHNREINLFGEELDIDINSYYECEESGSLKVYTVRDESNLVGYCAFFLYDHTHHRALKVAQQDVLYVDPRYRRCGLKLLRYTEERLKKESVAIILQAAPKISRLDKVLERMNYIELETVYMKRI